MSILSLPIRNRDFQLPADGKIHVVPVGEYPVKHDGKTIVQVVDGRACDAMVANLESQMADPDFPGLCVDFDHFRHDPTKESRAAGWVMNAERRSDGVYTAPRWSTSGKAAVQGGDYRFISPEFDPATLEHLGGNRYRPTRLVGFGLTNAPNMKGITALTNRQGGAATAAETPTHAEAHADLVAALARTLRDGNKTLSVHASYTRAAAALGPQANAAGSLVISNRARELTAWWIDDLVATLELFRQRHIATAREAIAETEVTRMVHDAIDRAAFCVGLAVIEGDQRTGKSTAAKNYCETHPGECVFIDLEAGSDETSFFRSFARSIGTASSGQYTAIKLRGKIEDMLQAGHLTVVIDEAHYLMPITARPNKPPGRLEWVRRSLLDKGVPVVFVSTPQFDRQCDHYEKHLKWNAKQIKGRIVWQRLLPATLPEAEVMAVARKIAPQADAASIMRLTAYALDAEEYLFGIKRIMDNAAYLAFKAGRAGVTREDIKRTLDDVAPTRTATAKPRKAPDLQTPCKRVETPLQTASENFSEVVPRALARRAGLDVSNADALQREVIEQPRFNEAAPSH